MKKKCVELPKPRALAVNEILRSKKGGKHQDHLATRSNRKSETKREISASLKGSKWSPFFLTIDEKILST